MTSIRARVRGGRLVVDAPTDLPEGLEVTLAIVRSRAPRTSLDAIRRLTAAHGDR